MPKEIPSVIALLGQLILSQTANISFTDDLKRMP